jgi:uncharacterized membrane protein
MTNASPPSSHFGAGEFRIGHVFSESWSVLMGNFVKLCVVTGIISLPSVLLRLALPAGTLDPFGGATPINPVDINTSAIVGAAGLSGILFLLLMPLSEAIIFYVAVQHMRRKQVNLVEGLEVGLGRFFPLIGIALLVVLALAGVVVLSVMVMGAFAATGSPAGVVAAVVAVFATAVPYFMLIIMWSVAGPACVIERLGPVRSLGRSRELTKGHRWKIFALTILAVLCGLPLGIALGAAGYFITPVLRATISLIFNAVWLAFFWIMYAVAYRDLRVVYEGLDTDQAATVFE